MGNVCGRRGVDACELAPQTPYQSARMARKVTEQRFSSKKLQDRAGLAPGWRALNRFIYIYIYYYMSMHVNQTQTSWEVSGCVMDTEGIPLVQVQA